MPDNRMTHSRARGNRACGDAGAYRAGARLAIAGGRISRATAVLLALMRRCAMALTGGAAWGPVRAVIGPERGNLGVLNLGFYGCELPGDAHWAR